MNSKGLYYFLILSKEVFCLSLLEQEISNSDTVHFQWNYDIPYEVIDEIQNTIKRFPGIPFKVGDIPPLETDDQVFKILFIQSVTSLL